MSRLRVLAKVLLLLLILLLLPYRITRGISPNAVHTWIMSLFWHIHFDEVSYTLYFTTQIILVMIFLLIILPAVYFYATIKRKTDTTFPKFAIFLSLLVPPVLELLIILEDEMELPISLSRYEWQTLYAFSLVVFVIYVFLPLFLQKLITKSPCRRKKHEATITVLSVIALPTVVTGTGRMFTHYTYNELVLYAPLWSALLWERSGAFYSASEFVFEFYKIPSLSVAFVSFFFSFLFIYRLFRNYGNLKSRTSTLIIGAIGILSTTLFFYIMSLLASDVQRVYVFALPIPISFIIGLFILKFSYPKVEVSIKPEDFQQTVEDDLLEVSIRYRLMSWLRKRAKIT